MRHDDLIENKGSHKYLRRIPWPGRKKKYRYVYDSRIAAQLPVQPSPGEKVRVPHGEQPGHYEILRVLKLGTGVVADLQHDETGYRMFVPVENLHKLVKEALTTPPKPKKTKSPKITAAKLRAEYRKADALPKARWRTLNMILDSSGVQDYGLRKRDQQYLSWQRGTDKKPAPLPDKDGSLDGFNVRGERKTRFCCLREAFNHATANAETWRDLIPVVEKLRTVPDLEGVNLPAEVMSRHAEEDATLRGVEAGLVAPTVDYTRYGVPFDGGMPEDDLLFLAITHDPEAAAQAGGFEAPDEPEEDPWMNPFDTPADAQAWLNARAAIGKHRLHADAARQQARYDPEAHEVAEYHDAEADRLEAELAARRRENPYDPADDPLSDVYVVDTETLEDGTVVKYVGVPFPVERKPLAYRDDPKAQGLVNLANLVATQRRVTVAGVEKYLDERMRAGTARMPAILVYETSDGRQYIADGHHRAFAALIRGMETFPAIIQFVRE
jgi:hypothetical protein